MKHYILAKFIDKNDLERYFEDIKQIYDRTLEIEGVNSVVLHRSNSDRANRYDLMIEMTLSEEALNVYDECEAHKEWKERYGGKLQSKAIFDCEEDNA